MSIRIEHTDITEAQFDIKANVIKQEYHTAGRPVYIVKKYYPQEQKGVFYLYDKSTQYQTKQRTTRKDKGSKRVVFTKSSAQRKQYKERVKPSKPRADKGKPRPTKHNEPPTDRM
jgi:hypothetical protein